MFLDYIIVKLVSIVDLLVNLVYINEAFLDAAER
jgi:hypothetical protein